MVINQFIDRFNLDESYIDLYYLDIWKYRSVSDEVGYKFQVLHQFPQLIVIEKGIVVSHASHGAIHSINLNKFI